MLSKRVIMHEWREFVSKRDSMTDRYVGVAGAQAQADQNPDAPPNSPGTPNPATPNPDTPSPDLPSPPPRPGTPARAPAALSFAV